MISSCPNCNKKLLTDHSFCPNCGVDLRSSEIESNRNNKNNDNKTTCPTCGSSVDERYSFCAKCGAELKLVLKTKKTASYYKQENRWSGVRTTFFWSIALSAITVVLYIVKETSPIDDVAKNVVQGTIVRPSVVALMALIFSSFSLPEKKISKFNSACNYIMSLLTVTEFFKWLVILNAL